MSELVLIASDLYLSEAPRVDVRASPAPALVGEAALAQLSHIARFGSVEVLPRGWRSWLAGWLGRGDLAGASPASIAAASMDSLAQWPPGAVWFADPVHLVAGPTSLHLFPGGILALDRSTQQALCSAFAETFADSGYRLLPARAGRFLVQGPAPPGEVSTFEPARLLGSSLADALARGPGAAALLALGGHVEMWLHEHPLNRRRVRERLPPISTLWLWGGGSLPLDVALRGNRSSDPSAAAMIFGDDSYVDGLARLCGARVAPMPAGGGSIADPSDGSYDQTARRAVVLELFRADCDGSSAGAAPRPRDALERFDREWVAPALEQMRRRTLSRVTIVANDRRLSITPSDRLRVWRPRRAALEALR